MTEEQLQAIETCFKGMFPSWAPAAVEELVAEVRRLQQERDAREVASHGVMSAAGTLHQSVAKERDEALAEVARLKQDRDDYKQAFRESQEEIRRYQQRHKAEEACYRQCQDRLVGALEARVLAEERCQRLQQLLGAELAKARDTEDGRD